MSKRNASNDPAKNALECILGQKTVGFYPVIAKALGSVPAAVMVSQGLFWQYKADHKKEAQIGGEGYFSKTVAEWYEETSITESAQRQARELLLKHGVMKEKLSGVPAKMHFRVDIDSLVAVINGYLLNGVSVAVKHGNKKRQLTRTSGGKFRRQEAVKDGNIIIESFESFETTTEMEEVAAAGAEFLVESTTEIAGVTLVEKVNVEAEKENPTPSSAAPLEKEKEPSARPAPGESAPRRWDVFDIDREADMMKSDFMVFEKYARDLGLTSETAKEKFSASVDEFITDQKAATYNYQNTRQVRTHFFNWILTAPKAKAAAKTPGASAQASQRANLNSLGSNQDAYLEEPLF